MQSSDIEVEVSAEFDDEKHAVNLRIENPLGEPITQTVSYGEFRRYLTEQRGNGHMAELDIDAFRSVEASLSESISEEIGVDPERIIIYKTVAPWWVEYAIAEPEEGDDA